MTIDVVLIPQEFKQKRLQGQVTVVLDILRATSTIVTALNNHALRVIPVVEPEEALALQQEIGIEDCVVGGERKGFIIKDFNYGNSPAEYTIDNVAGKTIVLCTSNGTKAIHWANEAREVIIGSFLNMATILEYLQSIQDDITIICAGREGNLSLEDLVAAGMIVSALTDRTLSDTAKVALYAFEKAKAIGLTLFVGQTEHGCYLQACGMEADIALCTELNKYSHPAQIGGWCY